jgi:parallel beta-helix repeat protein
MVQRLAAVAGLLAVLLVPRSAVARTWDVTTPADKGPGSLREAIEQTNRWRGPDVITFHIPASGVQTITLLSPLPPVTDTLTIDASTQGDAKDHLVELDGTWLPPASIGLDLQASRCVIDHLTLTRFPGYGLHLAGTGGHTIRSSHIGVDPSGTVEQGNYAGVWIASPNNVVGGAGGRNVVSGNSYIGIYVSGVGNRVEGNYVGPNAAAGNFAATGDTRQSFGIQLWSVGAVIRNNVIAGSRAGITLDRASGNVIQGNRIGTNGTGRIGSLATGILVDLAGTNNVIGGPGAGQGNTIAYVGWMRGAIHVTSGTGNAIRGNRIYAVSAPSLSIDLDPTGTVANDLGDPDVGANNGQNAPVVTYASTDGAATTVLGELWSLPNTPFAIDVYGSPVNTTTGSCEARAYLGATTVLTDANGRADFRFSGTTAVPAGQFVSATATRQAGPRDTSEISACAVVYRPR